MGSGFGSILGVSVLLAVLGGVVVLPISTFFFVPPPVVVMMTRGGLPVVGAEVAGFEVVLGGSDFGLFAGAGFVSASGGVSLLPPPKSFLKKPGLSSASATSKDADARAKTKVAMTAWVILECNPGVMTGMTAKMWKRRPFIVRVGPERKRSDAPVLSRP